MRSWRLVTAGCATAAVIIGWVALEKGLAVLYSNMRPELELRSADVLGRPVELGRFRSLSWQGFHIGPSRVLAGTHDQSQLSVEGLTVSLNPLASLQQGRWVLHLHVLDLRGELRRNAQGSFWMIASSGSRNPMRAEVWPHTRSSAQFEIVQASFRRMITSSGSRNPMPAEVWLHTRGPAQFKVWLESESEQQPDLAVTLEGRVALGHARHGTVAEGEALFHNNGRLSFHSQGTPLSATWEAHGEADGLQLAVLRPFLVDSPWQGLSGRVDGKMAFNKAEDGSCHGAIEAGNLQLPISGPDWVEQLGIDTLKLHCHGQRIELAGSGFHGGELAGQLEGSLDLDGQLNLNASLVGPLPPAWNSVVAGGELNSELHLFGPVTALEGRIDLTIADWWRRESTVEAMTPDQLLPPLKAQVQLASEWRSSAQDFQLWGSLQTEAGKSNLAVTGQLVPNLHLQSTTLNVAPREWFSPFLADLLFPPQPYEGQVAVKQTAAGQELDLRLHNPQLEEPLSLKLVCDVLLELKACGTPELTGLPNLIQGIF